MRACCAGMYQFKSVTYVYSGLPNNCAAKPFSFFPNFPTYTLLLHPTRFFFGKLFLPIHYSVQYIYIIKADVYV